MHPIPAHLKQKGLKDYFSIMIDNERMKNDYIYRGMFIHWDSKKPLNKFYYWRGDYFTSIEGAMRSIDRHIKLYKKLKNDTN